MQHAGQGLQRSSFAGLCRSRLAVHRHAANRCSAAGTGQQCLHVQHALRYQCALPDQYARHDLHALGALV